MSQAAHRDRRVGLAALCPALATVGIPISRITEVGRTRLKVSSAGGVSQCAWRDAAGGRRAGGRVVKLRRKVSGDMRTLPVRNSSAPSTPTSPPPPNTRSTCLTSSSGLSPETRGFLNRPD